MKRIDKQFVKKSFNSSALSYDAYAGLQRRLSANMVQQLDLNNAASRILDIGMGTGTFTALLKDRFPDTTICGCDIAFNMVLKARKKISCGTDTGAFFTTADAEFLPFKPGCFDLAVSSFAYQWIDGVTDALHEVCRVVKPGGGVFLSVFGENTFAELKTSWQNAASGQQYRLGEALNLHLSKQSLTSALQDAGFSIDRVETFDVVEYYDDIRHLFKTIKGMGSRNAAYNRNRTPAVRSVWQKMVRFYEQEFGTPGGIPATYQVITAFAKKREQRLSNPRQFVPHD